MKMTNTENNGPALPPGAEFGPEMGGDGERIACLADFMLPERYATLRRAVAMRTRYMTVLAENMFHGQNAAALIRHCEAFGLQEMHTIETLCRFEPSAAVVRARTAGSMCAATGLRPRRSGPCVLRATASWRRHPTARIARPKPSM